MIFTRYQAAQIRAGKITAGVVLGGEPITVGRLRALRRHLLDDRTRDEVVTDAGAEVVLTIITVRDTIVEDVRGAEARACGYKNPTALRETWVALHPRARELKVVRFDLGDTRERRDRYLAWTGRAGGDYTSNPKRAMDRGALTGDGPDLALVAPTAEEIAGFAHASHYRDDARRREADIALRDDLAERLARWDRETSGVTDRDRQQSIQGIRRSLASLDRKIKTEEAAA